MSGAGPAPPKRPSVTGDRRVTVDLDEATPLDLWRSWRELDLAGCYEIRARVSSGGEGFHLRAFIDADRADESDVEQIRLIAGDHPRRAAMDRRHAAKPPQVLFSSKPGGEASQWYRRPENAVRALCRRSERFGPDGMRGEPCN